jgi:hypothetical protein
MKILAIAALTISLSLWVVLLIAFGPVALAIGAGIVLAGCEAFARRWPA